MKNLYLNKMSISNARRFSKDVEIDFGKGATLLLAPNGTGKTTIFEAIEFALTGTLESRLGHPPNALISDGKEELDIRLDFDDNLFCEVSFRHDKEPVLKGNHIEILGDKLSSAPYLLGLTHILDQRGRDWFVTSDEKGAGNKLDKLSIGQGLNKFFSKKTSLSRVINQEIENLEERFNNNTEKQKQFSDLVEERNSESSEYNLVPLKDIYKSISAAYRLINDNEEEVELKQDKLSLFLEKTKVSLNNEISDILTKKVKLSSVESKLETYKNNDGIIDNRENQLKTNKQNIKELNNQLDKIKQKLESEEKNKAQLDNRLKNNNLLQDKLNLLSEKTKEKSSEIKARKLVEEMFEKQQIALDSSNKLLTSVLKLIKEHKVIDSEIFQVKKKHNDIRKLKPQLDEWKCLSSLSSNISKIVIPNYEKDKLKLSEQLEEINKQGDDIAAQIKKTNQSIKLFEESTNAILNSVTSISKHLPDNQEVCPVCNTRFSPEELQNQIKIALEAMDPAAHNLTETLKKLELEQKEIGDKRTNRLSKLKELEKNIHQQNKKLNETNDKIDAILKCFPDCNNITEAQEYISLNTDKLDNSLKILEEKKKTIKEKPLEDFITNLRIENEKLKVDYEKYTEELRVKEVNIKKLSAIINEIEEQTKEVDTSKLSEEKEILTKDISDNVALLKDITKKRDTLLHNLEVLNQEYSDASTYLLKIKSQQSEIETEWSDLELKNKPNIEELMDAKNKADTLKTKYSSSLLELNDVEQQLVTWQKASRFIVLDKKVKSECGKKSEKEHFEELQCLVAESQRRLDDMKMRQTTINTLFNNVNAELKQVNKYLDSINQPWSELLNRIIVNSRFSTGSLLKSSTYRNKPIAGVEALLNGSNIPVNQIASEAQLTDLQLTFMLAMAKHHYWTPWRALLLDDPTQHHDLVHASSVFDLLRDYISDLNFQLLFSTHDSQQVNFFRRKLDNDGINNKVYKLKVGEDGVFADLI